MNDSDQHVQDIIILHQDVHRQLREAITGESTEALNWAPGPDTSSIGVIVTHALGAEAEMLRNILQIPTNRNRDDEFAPKTHEVSRLLGLVDTAEEDWRELGSRITESDLRASRPRPNKPVPQTGLFWLVRNYGHMREHLAQVNITKQLYHDRNR